MSFRDDVALDITDTFLCLDEFAEICEINGKEMLAGIEKKSLDTASKNENGMHKAGTHKKRIVLQVAADTYGPLPAAGSLISVNGKKYIVLSSNNEHGMYTINLEVSRG